MRPPIYSRRSTTRSLAQSSKRLSSRSVLLQILRKRLGLTGSLQWYTAFPQIVSRIGIKNEKAYETLALLIQMVIKEYPKQALWPFTAIAKSTSQARAKRSRAILQKLKVRSAQSYLMDTSERILQSVKDVYARILSMTKLTEELLKFCRADVREAKIMYMSKSYKDLYRMFNAEDTSHDILIPLQESLAANLPPQSASESTHQPFPVDAPVFKCG